MKYLIILLIVLLCFNYSEAQSPKEDFFFNEVFISANRTLELDQNTVGQFGFGIGLDRVIFRKKKVNLIVGIGYNYLRITKNKLLFHSDHYILTDAKYRLHNISVPIGIRYNIGRNKRFYLEGGAHLNLLFSKVRANKLLYYPNESSKINEGGGIRNYNVGVFCSFGFSLPLNEFHSLYIKMNYNYDFFSLIENDYFILSYAKIAVGYSF